MPTAGLARVAGLDARLEDAAGTLWTRLPETLPAGWYLVEHPSAAHRAQAVLQVTDIAGYLIVSETETLVWANDLVSDLPIVGAEVSSETGSLGRTVTDGTLLVPTPTALLADQGTGCAGPCAPVVIVSSGGQTAFLPATGSNSPDGKEGDSWSIYGDGDPRYWRVFHTDRTRYRQTDAVNVWGMLRDRDSGDVPDSVTIRSPR